MDRHSKDWFLWVVLAIIIICYITDSKADTTFYMDKNGQARMTHTTIGTSSYYNEINGKSLGYSTTIDNTTNYYSPSGKSLGYSTTIPSDSNSAPAMPSLPPLPMLPEVGR